MLAFDDPRCPRNDLTGRQNPLLQQAFNDGPTDLEFGSGLLQRQPLAFFLITGQAPFIPYIIYMISPYATEAKKV